MTMRGKNIRNNVRGAALAAFLFVPYACSPPKPEPVKTVVIPDGEIDPAVWGKAYPEEYETWKMTEEPTPAGKSKYKRGFDADRMYTPQGDYGLYQCLTPCTREVWPSEPIIRQSLDNYDPATGKVSPEAIPSCPNCGGRVFLNVYAGAWYINDHFRPGLDRLNDWLAETRESGETLAVVEIGAGFNTPGVIRWPGEQVTRALPNARLIRINRDHPDVPDDLADRAWAIAADARTVIEQLTHPSGASS